MLTKQIIEENINILEQMESNFNERLGALPEGSIYYKLQHGKARPYRRIYGKEIYLPHNEARLIEGLTNRKEIERALDVLNRNVSLLKGLKEEYSEPEEMIPSFLRICKFSGNNEIITAGEVSKMISKWHSISTGNPRYRKGVNVASDGTFVKSRADLLGYEHLKMRGVEFKYEHPIMINGNLWYPDFTIYRRKDYKMFIWEHLGMMDKVEYRKKAERKLYEYAREGYLPFDNLLLTYDFGDDSIDLVWVDKMLKLFDIID